MKTIPAIIFPVLFLQACAVSPQALRVASPSAALYGQTGAGGAYLYSSNGNSAAVKRSVRDDKAVFTVPVEYKIIPAVLPEDLPRAVKDAYAGFGRDRAVLKCETSHDRETPCDRSDKEIYADCRYLRRETAFCSGISREAAKIEINNYYKRSRDDSNIFGENIPVNARLYISGSAKGLGFEERITASPAVIRIVCDAKSCVFLDDDDRPVNSITVENRLVFDENEIKALKAEEDDRIRREKISDFFSGQ